MENEFQLSNNLNFLIEKEKTSLTKVAKNTKINVSTIHNYCNGVFPRGLIAILRVAEHFEVKLSDLLYVDLRQKKYEATRDLQTINFPMEKDIKLVLSVKVLEENPNKRI